MLISIDSVESELDNNMTNNQKNILINVTETKDFQITFYAINNPNNFEESVSSFVPIIKAMYPISDDGINYQIGKSFLANWHPWFILMRVSRLSIISQNIVRTVGILPTNWFIQKGYNSHGFGNAMMNGVLVEYLQDSEYIPAHELGHSFGLCDEYDNDTWNKQNMPLLLYPCPNGDKDDNNQLDQECIPNGCPASTLGKLVPWNQSIQFVQMTNFMGNSKINNTWISIESYNQLLKKFKKDTGVTAISTMMISGFVNKSSNSIELYPAYELGIRTLTQINDTPRGNYSIDVRDDNNNPLFYMNFTPSFYLSFWNGSTIETNETYFIFIINNSENISRIQVAFNGTIKDTLNKTPNSPVVFVNTISQSQPITTTFNLTWASYDADNDTLYNSILVSDDNGSTWTTLEVDYENTTYEINPEDFSYSDEYVFKVITTDSFNSGENISNTISMGVKDISINSLRNISTSGKNVTLEFIFKNNHYTTQTNINFTLDTGNNFTINNTHQINLSADEVIIGLVQYNYTSNGGHMVVLNVTSAIENDSKNFRVCIGGTCGPWAPNIRNLTNLESNRFVNTIGFEIFNNDTLAESFWFNASLGDGTELSVGQFNLTGNESLIALLEHKYTQPGMYQLNVSAWDNELGSWTTFLIEVFTPVSITQLQNIEADGTSRLFLFWINNQIDSDYYGLNFTFNTGEDIINSSGFNLTEYESLISFVEHNYTSSGNYTVNATLHAPDFTDSEAMEVII